MKKQIIELGMFAEMYLDSLEKMVKESSMIQVERILPEATTVYRIPKEWAENKTISAAIAKVGAGRDFMVRSHTLAEAVVIVSAVYSMFLED